MNKKYNTISEIPERNYQGYVWLSDQEKPFILPGDTFDFSTVKENENPFIIEALLYAKDENISVSVKHTGKHHIHEIDLKDLPKGAELREIQYLPHRLDRVEKLNFKQLWFPEPDESCEGMEVLKMKALIFTGFTNTKS